MLLVHPAFRPGGSKIIPGTEYDVWSALKKLGFAVEAVSLRHDLGELDRALAAFKPEAVFNLLEEFRDEGVFDFHAITRLESLGVPYTGCNPRGLIVSRNKFWVSQIAKGAGVLAPESALMEGAKIPRSTRYPAFVKFNREHASLGITNSNRASNALQVRTAAKRMRRKLEGEILIQEFIPGQDVSVAVFGNDKATVLPAWTLSLGSKQSFATERVKFSAELRRRNGIRAIRYRGQAAEAAQRDALKLFRVMDLNGYARFDFRISGDSSYIVDVNANPNLSRTEDFAASARAAGIDYEDLLKSLISLAKAYQPKI
jgi:D-alanine-D-alanine ligase